MLHIKMVMWQLNFKIIYDDNFWVMSVCVFKKFTGKLALYLEYLFLNIAGRMNALHTAKKIHPVRAAALTL